MVGIIDYGLGNVKALSNIYQALGVKFVVAKQASDLARATHVILPGVGAFDQAMARLNASGMRDVLDATVGAESRPLLGICVGMQMLADRSDEGVAAGLGWIPGEVRKFTPAQLGNSLRVPHMGWNDVRPLGSHALFKGLERDSLFYFLHSYCFNPRDASDVLATASYGTDFACAVGRKMVFGVQFHPEKSHNFGIQLLKNFAEI